MTRLACEAAKRHGVTVSVDLNFRKKLWTKEKAQSIMKPLMKYVDVCIGNEEDAELCLGFKPDADVEAGHTDAEGYKGIFQQMMKEFGFKYVVSTLRESFSATHNGWKAMIYNGEEFYTSKRYDIDPIIDRVGGGDSFSGGIIHGLMTKPNQGAALEFAVAASALKHTINGDFNLVSVEEVEALAGGEANVAVSCANYGHDAYFVTKLPKHEIGQSAVNALRKYGVKTDFIARGGDRVGIYYLETGASMRPSKVIYDRAHSAIVEADAADFDFDAIMEGADWFHWSGITPAILSNFAILLFTI